MTCKRGDQNRDRQIDKKTLPPLLLATAVALVIGWVAFHPYFSDLSLPPCLFEVKASSVLYRRKRKKVPLPLWRRWMRLLLPCLGMAMIRASLAWGISSGLGREDFRLWALPLTIGAVSLINSLLPAAAAALGNPKVLGLCKRLSAYCHLLLPTLWVVLVLEDPCWGFLFLTVRTWRNERLEVIEYEDHYQLILLGQITLKVPKEPFDLDVILVLLRQLQDPQGRPLFTLQEIADAFDFKARQNIDIKLKKWRQAGGSLRGIIPSHKKWVVTPELRQRVIELWTDNPFLTAEEVKTIVVQEGLAGEDICLDSIREAVRAVDFNPIRASLKRRLEKASFGLRRDWLIERLLEIIEGLLSKVADPCVLSPAQQVELEQIRRGFSPAQRSNAARLACLKEFLLGRVEPASLQCPCCHGTHVGRKTGQPERVEVYQLDGTPKQLEVYRFYCRNRNCPLGSFRATLQGEWVYSPLEISQKFVGFRLCIGLGLSYRKASALLDITSSTAYLWAGGFGDLSQELLSFLGVLRYSGVVCIDEKWVLVPKNDKPAGKKRRWMYVYMAVDPYTYDLLHIEIYPHNDYLSTKAFLLALKAKGYRPRVIITDMLAAYEVAIPEVFEKAIHQFCIFHALQGAQRKIKEIWGKNYEKIPEAVALKTQIYQIFRARTQRTVRKRFEEVMALREVYVASQPDAAELFDNLEHQFPHLIHAIGNPSIPRTNNAVELTNRRFDQLYSTMCGFDSIESARRYLRGFELAYRFTPLSQEVKDPAMRGKCPLEIAGYQVRHLPLWGYLNTPLSMRVESCAVNFGP